MLCQFILLYPSLNHVIILYTGDVGCDGSKQNCSFFRKAKWPLELSKIVIENSLGLLESELLHCHPYSEDHVPVLRKTVGLATMSIRTWL